MKIDELDERFVFIKSSYEISESKIRKLEEINSQFKGAGCFLAVNGSLARKEVVESSDFDAFPVRQSRDVNEAKCSALWREAQLSVDLVNPGSAGIFGMESCVLYDDIIYNIGGDNDTNKKITQRILIILESFPVGDIEIYDKLVESIINRYISDGITDHQLGLFLLNDIIRYYRTICVDFEFKTEEDSKPWGIRNIKLVYSRKLIYFSGLLICAELAQRTAKQKRDICNKLLRMTPVERMLSILGAQAVDSLLLYEKFLSGMADISFREDLKLVTRNNARDHPRFREMKNDGHHFTWALRSAFMRHYDASHPIHKAIMF